MVNTFLAKHTAFFNHPPSTRLGYNSEGSFAYQYRLQTQTRVLKNDSGSRVTFEVTFIEAEQLRAIATLESLRFVIPENSLAGFTAPRIDEVLHLVPYYRVVRGLATTANSLDPNLGTSLTMFVKLLGLDKKVLQEAEDVELARRVTDLAGAKLEIEYDRVEGITSIKVLEGKSLPRESLESLAHHGSLLLDYYVLPSLKKQQGDSWDVNAKDIAGLLSDGFECEADGMLTLQRKEDEMLKEELLANLEITQVEVRLSVQDGGESIESTVKSKPSIIKYSVKDKLVRSAQIDWDATYEKFPATHLLFGTQSIRDIECRTHYEARIKAATDHEKLKSPVK